MNQKPVVLDDKTGFRKLLEQNQKLESHVESLKKRLQLTQKLEKINSAELKLGGVLHTSLEMAIAEFDFEMGGIYLFEEKTDDLVLIIENNLKNDFNTRIPENDSQNKRQLVSRFQTGSVLSANLPTIDILLNQFLKPASRVKSVVMAAIKGRQQFHGILCLAERRSYKTQIAELEHLALISRTLGWEIENFRLGAQMEQLHKQNDLLLKNTLAGVFILQDQKFIFVNDRLAEIYGCNREELLSIDFSVLEWPLDLLSERGSNSSLRKINQKEFHYQFHGRDQHGNPLYLEIKTALIENNGKSVILGNVIDFSEQFRLQHMLELKEQQNELIFDINKNLQAIFDHTPGEICYFDENLNLIWANVSARQGKNWSLSHDTQLGCAQVYPFCKSDGTTENCAGCPLKMVLEKDNQIRRFHHEGETEGLLERVYSVQKNDTGSKGLVFTLESFNVADFQQILPEKRPENEQSEKTEAILDSINASILVIDETGKIVFLNPAAGKFFHWNPGEVLERNVARFYKNLSVTQQKIIKLMLLNSDETDAGKFKDKIVTESNRKDGIVLSMEWSFSTVFMREITATLALGRDITHHKKMEMELNLKNDFLENILNQNPFGIEIFNLQGKLVYSNAVSDSIYGNKSQINYCLFQDLVFNEAGVLPEIKKAFLGETVSIGPLCYDNVKTGFPGRNNQNVFVQITFAPVRSGSGMIENVLAIHKTPQTAHEEQALAAEKRSREIVDHAGDGIFILDSSGAFTFVNPEMTRLLGVAPELLIGKSLKTMIPEPDLPVVEKSLDIIFKEAKTSRVEFLIRQATGQKIFIEFSGVPVFRENHVVGLQAICRDITERKSAEKILRDSKKFYSILVEQSNDGVILIRPDGTFKFVNEGLCRLTKYQRKELLEQKFIKFLTRKSIRKIARLVRSRQEGEHLSDHMELEVRKKDGQILYVEIYLKSIQLNEESTEMIHLRDLSTRHQAEEKIRILSTAVESSEDGVFITDQTGELLFLNKAMAQMFGYTPQEWADLPPKLLYEKDSLELLQNKIGPTVLAGRNWAGELIARRKSGETFPILQTISPIYNEDGKQLGTVGISKDISEQKRIETTLRKNNQFLQKIIELNPYGVQIFDSAGKTLRVNRAFQKMFHQERLEDADLLFIDRAENSLRTLLNNARDGKLVSDSPIWINLKEIFPGTLQNQLMCVNTVLFPIVDDQKRVTNVVGLFEDITEREQYHTEIHRHNRELTALYDAGQAMVSIREPDMLIWSILRGATMAAGTEFGVFFSYSKNDNRFNLSTTIGFTEEQLLQIYENFRENYGNEAQAIYWYGDHPNVLTPKDLKKATDLMSPKKIFKSTLWVPVVYEDELLGVFNLFSKTPEVFTEESIRLVTMFADQAAVALENVRLYSEVTLFAEKMEMKIAERTSEVVASETKFRSIVENSPDLISIENSFMQTIFGNPAFFEKLGYSVKEAPQISSLKLIHPEDLAIARDAFENLQNSQAIRNLECRYRCKNGRVLHLLLSAEKLRSGENVVFQFVGRDITEKKQLEDTLKKSEGHHRALINNVKDGVYTLKNNIIIWCNEQLAGIFGYEPHELIGSFVAKLFADQTYFLNYEQELFHTLSKKGHYLSEFKGQKKNGDLFDLECSISLIEQNGTMESEALVIVRDITNQKRMQEKLIQSERLAATGKLAASVAHEINNPLQGIMASLAAISLKSPEQISGLNIIETGLKRISNIVKQLLSLHRPEQQEKYWVDVNQIVEEVVSLLQSQFSLNNIKIKKNLYESLPKIWGSSQQLSQVLINLLLNAQESISGSGEVQVFTLQKENEVLIKIIDTGKGIDPKDISKIFDPFHSTKKKMGTGLGLTVVHSAIEAHSGRIEIQSEINSGTEFTIFLPIKPVNEPRLGNRNYFSVGFENGDFKCPTNQNSGEKSVESIYQGEDFIQES